MDTANSLAKPERSSTSSRIGASLVDVVNPRLARYSNAGFIAALVLSCQVGIIVALTIVEQGNCARSSTTDKSWPNIYGTNRAQLEYMVPCVTWARDPCCAPSQQVQSLLGGLRLGAAV